MSTFESFEYNKYTLGVFIDFSKDFDTVQYFLKTGITWCKYGDISMVKV